MKGNRTSDTYSSGIGVWRCEDILIDGNDIRLACTGRKEVDPRFPTQECLSISGSNHVEVVNNHMHDSGNIGGGGGGEGIDVKNGSSHVKVLSNQVYNVNVVGIYVDAFRKHTHDIQISGNRVYDSSGNGIVLASEQGGLLERVTVCSNVIYGNMHNGITIGWALKPANPLKEIRVLHNTCYGNRRNGIYLGASSGDGTLMPEDMVVRNNICSENGASQMGRYHTVQMDGHTVSHNLLYGPSRYQGNKAVVTDPLFVDPGNGDFHLRSGSPAIDIGIPTDAPREDFDGNMRPWGSAPDMGAFEYGNCKPSAGPSNTPSERGSNKDGDSTLLEE